MKNLAIGLMLFLAFVAWTEWLRPYDDSDDAKAGTRSGFHVYKDNLTGCEYLSITFTGVTPRMDSKGRQVCRKEVQ